MKPKKTPTAAQQQQARAHEALHSNADLLGALRGFGEIPALHPEGPEPGDSRIHILAIVNRVVPAEELLASHTARVLGHLQPEGDRWVAPVGP